jgi:hypothetical protein
MTARPRIPAVEFLRVAEAWGHLVVVGLALRLLRFHTVARWIGGVRPRFISLSPMVGTFSTK